MQEIARVRGKNKTWRHATRFVMHSLSGQMQGLVANCEPEIEQLLEPANFPVGGPWVATVKGDTLHLTHKFYTACEGEA